MSVPVVGLSKYKVVPTLGLIPPVLSVSDLGRSRAVVPPGPGTSVASLAADGCVRWPDFRSGVESSTLFLLGL